MILLSGFTFINSLDYKVFIIYRLFNSNSVSYTLSG